MWSTGLNVAHGSGQIKSDHRSCVFTLSDSREVKRGPRSMKESLRFLRLLRLGQAPAGAGGVAGARGLAPLGAPVGAGGHPSGPRGEGRINP